ncbi:MAG: ABC transporter permease subunit [Actinobacteria bacterium]|uniref:Unannotated protein n=1 Tax=freshwater metagenome TaxID=449393 RepID=A0A6J7TDC5_9ZZZZ|nr:sugar ABC transporter permease [Actinomycetota bacterium]MSW47035.1 ABC transporter permease subunit [Actinomycetota bacterium]MSX25074.1 ABC transporter permease subunit [Actinomycetota bacterium]MSY46330.1 ABC transporter permease subunit [Actinomycetota bacterium]MSY56907.1 ABC transporter permease subunit [Actinomycetota bacterium]
MKPTSRLGVFILVAPAVLIYCFAVILPFIGTIALSFLRWNGFGSPTWAGLGNYSRALSDSIFRSTFSHVAIYIVATLILEVLLGLALAGFISSLKHSAFYRIALFVPVMLPMVVIAVLWRAIFNSDYGILNAILASLGLTKFQHIWLGDTKTALFAICFVSGWVFSGFYMAIFTAALNRLPTDVIESARLDGSGEMSIFTKIKIPMIRQVTSVAILICITGGLQGFDLFYVLTDGGPYHTTEVPTTFMVKSVFRDGEFGYGSALSIIVSVAGLAMAYLFNLWQKRTRVDVEY